MEINDSIFLSEGNVKGVELVYKITCRIKSQRHHQNMIVSFAQGSSNTYIFPSENAEFSEGTKSVTKMIMFKGLVDPKMKMMSLMTRPKPVRPPFIFRTPRAFCPSIGNVCMVYCPCPERK